MDVEQSEAPASSPNQRARGESREGNGGRLGAARRKENGREGGPRRGTAAWTAGLGQLRAVRSEAIACARNGGGLANKGGRWGAGDAAQHG
jgi:hypothetical protein